MLFLVLGCHQSTETTLVPAPTTVEDPEVVIQSVNLNDRLDQEWILVTLDDQGQQKKLLPKTQITIQFSAERLSGLASCNRYFASYQIKSNYGLMIKDVGTTRMACPEPAGIMLQEQQYLQLLSQAKTYYIRNKQLTLRTKDKRAILIFQQKKIEN